MKNKLKNIFIIFLILMILSSTLAAMTYCVRADDTQDIIEGMKGASGKGNIDENNKLVTGVNIVYTLIRVAGTGIALLMVMILGIKYMMSSVEEKADIKKQAVPILVGSALIFATSNILTIVAKIVFK
ncbi:MAG: hypothetical protein ACI4UE_05275 [Candidatus Scatovivens sp.]